MIVFKSGVLREKSALFLCDGQRLGGCQYILKEQCLLLEVIFNLRHAAGHTQCRCYGRQHTNGCLNREFPKCLVLHGINVMISL